MAASWRTNSTIGYHDKRFSKSSSRYRHRRWDSSPRRIQHSHRSRSLSPQKLLAWPVDQPASALTPPSPRMDNHSDDHRSNAHFPNGMELTPSGSMILLDDEFSGSYHKNTLLRDADLAAADGVVSHLHQFREISPYVQHAQVLKSLIHQCSSFDDLILRKILIAADAVFFHGTLQGRVQWEWSSAPRFQEELVGTTALRECVDARGGVECLIILSSPILKGGIFDRRLGIAVFLHELIHAFLFIRCGFTARSQGGHTEGFHRIAGLIDDWAGKGFLRLCNMTANLNYFLKGNGRWEEVVEDDMFSDPAFPVFKKGEKTCGKISVQEHAWWKDDCPPLFQRVYDTGVIRDGYRPGKYHR